MRDTESIAQLDQPAATRTTWRDWSCTVGVSVDRPQDAEVAATIVKAWMDEVARCVSRFRDDSELARCNARAGRLTPVSQLTCDLVGAALVAARFSDGLVDPTLGHHLEQIGYDADIDEVQRRTVEPHRPACASEVIERPSPPPGAWKEVLLDTDLRLVTVPVGHALDLGATAKAWTADRAAACVAAAVSGRALVEIGGDVAVVGAERQPFLVTVAEREGEDGELVEISSGGMATSTTTARRWMHNGTQQHHLIDPRAGRCANGSWRTATVWAPTCVEANTLSTAAIVRGSDAAEWLSSREAPARLVDQRGRTTHTAAWPLAQAGAA